MADTRTVAELRERWQKTRPFYYDLDHDGVGILFAEIDRLTANANRYLWMRAQASSPTVADAAEANIDAAMAFEKEKELAK